MFSLPIVDGYTNSTQTVVDARWFERVTIEPIFDTADFQRATEKALAAQKLLAALRVDPLDRPTRRMSSVVLAPRFAQRPRGKLDRWRSLKEKRRAWGFA